MLEDIKNIANIFFFITVGTVGVLTYLHAKKTIFAPLRTETFKLQLKVLEDLLLFFQHKGEHEFIEDFDMQRIVALNAFKMFDSYADLFFSSQIKFNKEARAERYKPLCYALIKAEDLLEIDIKSHKPQESRETPPETPALILAKWRDYRPGGIGYTKEHHEKMKNLQRFIASPLLPKTLRDILSKFQRAAQKNLALTHDVIIEAALEMPKNFHTTEDLKGIRQDWIWNIYNQRTTKLEPIAKEVLDFINNYLNIDGIAIPQT